MAISNLQRAPLIAGLTLAVSIVAATTDHALATSGVRVAAAHTDQRVLSRFIGGRITVADLEAAIANKDANARRRLGSAEARLRLLSDLETYALLIGEATRRGYAEHPVVERAARRAAVEAMLADLTADPASTGDGRPEKAVDDLVQRLRERHEPEIRADEVDAIALDPPSAPDRPRGFAPTPPDPRAAARAVEPDGF